MAPTGGTLENEYYITQAISGKTVVGIKLNNSSWSGTFNRSFAGILYIKHTIPLQLQKKNQPIEISWEAGGSSLLFSSQILETGTGTMGIKLPAKIIKSINRFFDRISPPAALTVSFSIAGKRYDLDFPKLTEIHSQSRPQLNEGFDQKDLRSLILDFTAKSENIADEKGLIMFRERKPQSLAERLCSASGKILYIPSSIGGLPVSDPFSESSLLTRNLTAQWLEKLEAVQGHDPECWRILEQSIREAGYKSALYIPVIFQHYTIGLLYLTVQAQSSKASIDLATVEFFRQYAHLLSRALHVNGYFKDAPVLENNFKAMIVNASAGGLLFSTKDPDLVRQLQEGSTVSIQLATDKRTVSVGGIVKRHFADSSAGYYGLQFTNMALEDFRFLFEFLYKRPFTDADSNSVELARILASQ